MKIGERIRSLRKEKKITQEQLASELGVKRAVISKYENENVNINVHTLERISSILGVNPSYLIGYDDKIVSPDIYSDDELTELKNTAWNLYKRDIEEKDSPEYKLNYSFSKLNALGKEKALERIDELTKIREYTIK